MIADSSVSCEADEYAALHGDVMHLPLWQASQMWIVSRHCVVWLVRYCRQHTLTDLIGWGCRA